ncbi:MAG TPA: cytochrome c oxidase assembly factor Coa1 family protein [Rhodocyclaceae bacterium]|nr:cytochrome c oxidase assembly factor Coa1 family protein [Rhodocyclaceae bacterium]
MENNSGQGKLASVPAEIDKWNWGAFLLNWIWGIGNNTFIALLMFVPLVNMIMPFVLGAHGSAWAWRNKRWDSVEQFRDVQRKWAKWSVIVYVALIGLFVTLFMSIMAGMKSSEAYKLAAEKLQSNAQAVSILGAPVSTGLPMGNIQVSGPTGSANMSFSAEGTVRNGTVYFEAVKTLGLWEIKRAVLELEGSGERIDLD